jgi:Putative transposase
VAYKGITFTMPDVLWPFFKDNPVLLRALPALAATVIQARMGAKHAMRLGVIAIPHTFNGKLEFNSHVHTMVTAGGLHGNFWLPRLYFDRDRLMKAWRRAVIRLLRTALLHSLTRNPFAEIDVILRMTRNSIVLP